MSFQSLQAYKKSFVLAMKIFKVSKSFPNEEKYSLIDQIRKYSRSVTVNISKELFNELTSESKEVEKLINYMINNPSEFGAK